MIVDALSRHTLPAHSLLRAAPRRLRLPLPPFCFSINRFSISHGGGTAGLPARRTAARLSRDGERGRGLESAERGGAASRGALPRCPSLPHARVCACAARPPRAARGAKEARARRGGAVWASRPTRPAPRPFSAPLHAPLRLSPPSRRDRAATLHAVPWTRKRGGGRRGQGCAARVRQKNGNPSARGTVVDRETIPPPPPPTSSSPPLARACTTTPPSWV